MYRDAVFIRLFWQVIVNFSRKSPLLLDRQVKSFTLLYAKTVKKSKNTDDDKEIVCYNEDGQKGAGNYEKSDSGAYRDRPYFSDRRNDRKEEEDDHEG